jgi:hypothetical protein
MQTLFLKKRDLTVLKRAGITITEILGQGFVIKGNEDKGYTMEGGNGVKSHVNVAIDEPSDLGYTYAVQD